MENWIKYFLGPAPATVTSSSCQSSQAESLSKDETSSPEAKEEDEEKNRRPKRSKFVDVQIPRNIMADPKVTAALDRTNTTPGQAMHLLSAVLKSAKKDGENLDLNEMFLSESTIRRGREKAQEEISKQQYEDFQDKKPDYLAVHWEIIF